MTKKGLIGIILAVLVLVLISVFNFIVVPYMLLGVLGLFGITISFFNALAIVVLFYVVVAWVKSV